MNIFPLPTAADLGAAIVQADVEVVPALGMIPRIAITTIARVVA